MSNNVECSPIDNTNGVDEAQSHLRHFVAAKHQAVEAGRDTLPARLKYLEKGLSLSANLLATLADRNCQQIVKLLNNAAAEIAAAVRSREDLIDEPTLWDLELNAGLAIDQAYKFLNALDESLTTNKPSHLRFAVQALDVYADRYQCFIDLVERLPMTEQVVGIWQEVGHAHVLVGHGEISLQNHLEMHKAKFPMRHPL